MRITLMSILCSLPMIFMGKIYAQESSLQAYNSYDFIAGDKIIFEDGFSGDRNGEPAARWKMIGGQASVSISDNQPALAITKYYTSLAPNIKTAAYLPNQFTVEFDAWLDAAYDGNDGVYLALLKGNTVSGKIFTNRSYEYWETPAGKVTGDHPEVIANEAYFNKWHHYAIAFNGRQIRVYCDQYRVLVVPDCGFKPTSLQMGGNASTGMMMAFRNFKVAAGGGAEVIGTSLSNGNYTSHGILFDVNKADIRPESMGEINAIVASMKAHPALTYEIQGYTDSDGDDAANLKLSGDRAQAVKQLLISLGIEASRLNANGYGETNPIGDNKTPEGKSLNRRVVFVKQ